MIREFLKSIRKIGGKVICLKHGWLIVNRSGYQFCITRKELLRTGTDAWYNVIYRTSNFDVPIVWKSYSQETWKSIIGEHK